MFKQIINTGGLMMVSILPMLTFQFFKSAFIAPIVMDLTLFRRFRTSKSRSECIPQAQNYIRRRRRTMAELDVGRYMCGRRGPFVGLVSVAVFILCSATVNAAPSLTVPLAPGFSNGEGIFVITTEASDAAVAAQSGVTLVPRLASLIAANATSNVYKVTNANQPNIFTAIPSPLGPDNSNADYSPFWRLNLVTWQTGRTRPTLRSEAEVIAAQAAGEVTVESTNIVINCPVVFTQSGGALPGALGIDPHPGGTISLPRIKGFASGDRVFAIITDASDKDTAASEGANFAPKMLKAMGSGAEEDLYVFSGKTNPAQDRVFEAHPTPVGPTNTEEGYTPAWNIVPVAFTNQSRHGFPLIRDEEDIYDLVEKGEMTAGPDAGIIVNCPILRSPPK